MRPSVGRIVHFRNPDPDDRHKRLDQLCNGGKCIAALVVGVDAEYGTVALDVRWPWAGEGRSRSFHDVPEGLEPGQWHWPERVE